MKMGNRLDWRVWHCAAKGSKQIGWVRGAEAPEAK